MRRRRSRRRNGVAKEVGRGEGRGGGGRGGEGRGGEGGGEGGEGEREDGERGDGESGDGESGDGEEEKISRFSCWCRRTCQILLRDSAPQLSP